MFEHFVLQLQLQRSIESFLENFKKIGRSNLTPTKVRSRMSTLKETWIQFCNGHTEISQRIPEATRSSFTYFKENHFESTYAAYNNAFDHMIEILEELEPIISPNSSLSSTRLLAHGRALECIANISIITVNFEITWNALTSQYNKQHSMNSHLSTLLNLSNITRKSASELQSLCDKIDIAITSLKKLDRKGKSYGTIYYLIKRCFNCLSLKHSTQECKSKYSCSALKNALSNCSEPQTSESTPEVNSLIASTKK
ncbi:hypothetical protein ACFW04_011405 [Cataglyphis niger]